MKDKARSDRRNQLFLTLTIFVGFLIFGLSENVKGPAIPRIQMDFSLSDLQLGFLLGLNSLGYLLACFYTAGLARKIGMKIALLLGLGVMVISGVVIFLSPNYFVLTLGYFMLYIGNGMLEITLGLMCAKIFTKNTGAMMSLSHFFYGLSSCVAPLLATGLMALQLGPRSGWRVMYLITLCMSLIPMIPALLGKLKKSREDKAAATGHGAYLQDRRAWLLIGILSFGVTCEMAISGWLANYAEKAHGISPTTAAAFLTAFFVCFTLSRLLLGPLIEKIGLAKSLLVFNGFAGSIILLGVLLGKPGLFLLVAAGLGVAPLYPTVMALLAKLFASNIDSAMTVTLSLMGVLLVFSNFMIGGIVEGFTWLFRGLGDGATAAGYSAGFVFIGLCCVAAFLISLALYRRMKKDGGLL